MTRATPTDIITHLTTKWDTDLGGVKPTFINQFEGEEINAIPSIGVNWASINWAEEAKDADTERNIFLIEIVASSLTNLNTKLSHTRNLLRTKSLAGGHYFMPSATPIKTEHNYIFFLSLEEVLYVQ